MEKGTLILICGLPGAGKTTLAKKLEHQRNALRLCPDEWIFQLLENKKDIKEMDRLRDPVEQLLWKETQRLLQLGVTIILENGFWPKAERDSYRDKARELQSNVELHFLNATHDVLWERVQKRNNIPEELIIEITEDNLKDWQKLFDPPTEDEGATYDFYKKYE